MIYNSSNKIFAIFLALSMAFVCNAQTKVENKEFNNLYKINDSIYRSEQPTDEGFLELEELGIKSSLNLRNHHNDEDEAENSTIQLYRVEMDAHHITDEDVVKALELLISAPKPVVVHCKHGSDRTGLIIAMYRIIYQNWTKEEALNELVNGGYGYHPIFKNIPKYIEKVDIDKIKNEILNFE